MEIKANAHVLVNSLAATLFALLILQPRALAEEAQLLPEETVTQPLSPAESLPPIQARAFKVKTVKRSTSGQIYLMDDALYVPTQTGKILLLKHADQPAMAFRVIKTYPEKNQFAAKRLRTYEKLEKLALDESFDALEKVGDITSPPPTPQDSADLKELEAAEPESKPTETPAAPPLEPDEELSDMDFGTAVDEIALMDTSFHSLNGSLGFLRNYTPSGSSAYFTGAGLRYGYTLGKMVFLKHSQAQDSLVAEGGVFYYKILNYEDSQNDSYTLMPLVGTLRYNVSFSENFGIFFYLGIMQNLVVGSEQGSSEMAAILSSTIPAGGGGILFRVGPGWDARVDLGIEMISLGLTLRF